jgi:hypothetical protein
MPSSIEESYSETESEIEIEERTYYESGPIDSLRRVRRDIKSSTVKYHPVTENGKQIEIQSKHLVQAIKNVNKHPPLRSITDHFVESKPYPTLFDHMEDVHREIEKLNDEDARRDLKRLKEVIEDVAHRWKQAREDKCDSGLVSFDMVWTLFRAGDRVVREDSIGNLWVFVLVDVAERQERIRTRSSGIGTQHYIEFTTWFLTWDGFENELSRQSVMFRLYPFPGRREITSLPVYPIQYTARKHGDDVDKFLAKRGQKWWSLIKPRTSCLRYDGPALSHKLEDDSHQRDVVLRRSFRRSEWEVRQNRVRVSHTSVNPDQVPIARN